jgi:hypothetical protein
MTDTTWFEDTVEKQQLAPYANSYDHGFSVFLKKIKIK